MAISAGNYNIFIDQGATYDTIVELYDSSTPPIPINLTGFTAKMMGRTTTTNMPPPFFILTSENGGLTLGGVDGTIRIYMTDELTAELYQNGVYDLIIISPDGEEVDRILEGKIIINKRVTT